MGRGRSAANPDGELYVAIDHRRICSSDPRSASDSKISHGDKSERPSEYVLNLRGLFLLPGILICMEEVQWLVMDYIF